MKQLLWMLLLFAACSSGGPGTAEEDPQPDPQPDPLAEPHTSNEVILSLEEPEDQDEIDELLEDFAGLDIERVGPTLFVLTVPDGTDLAALLEDLDDDLRVVAAEPNYLGESPEGGPGNVKVLGDDLIAAIATQPGYAGLDLATAHAVTTGTGVIVAVVDTGLDLTHPLFAGRIAPGARDLIDFDDDPTDERNFTDDDGDGLVDEQFGHGTFVASQILSVAPDARILPIRVLNDEGFTTAAVLAAAIIEAVDAGAHVINLSVTLPRESESIKEALKYARGFDVVLVGAAGNGGADKALFPATQSDVLGVSAVGETNALPAFANRAENVTLVAPGVDLIGAVPLSLGASGTARWSGTSFSAPLVAGTAALVRSRFPGLSAEDVRQRLRSTALELPNEDTGNGLVQPAVAVQ